MTVPGAIVFAWGAIVQFHDVSYHAGLATVTVAATPVDVAVVPADVVVALVVFAVPVAAVVAVAVVLVAAVAVVVVAVVATAVVNVANLRSLAVYRTCVAACPVFYASTCAVSCYPVILKKEKE